MARYTAPLFISVVEVERCYGGPEEGGWWYDATNVLYVAKLTRTERAHVDRLGRHWPISLRAKRSAVRKFEGFAAAHFGYLRVKPSGYRDRGSVIGGPDVEIRITPYIPENTPAQRPHYE